MGSVYTCLLEVDQATSEPVQAVCKVHSVCQLILLALPSNGLGMVSPKILQTRWQFFFIQFWLADFCSERARPELICVQINGPEKITGPNQFREK